MIDVIPKKLNSGLLPCEISHIMFSVLICKSIDHVGLL